MSLIVRTAVNGTASVGAASVQILPERRHRKYALIVNASDVGIWLSFGATAVIGTGAYLAPSGGSYEIDETNLWTEAVNGIAASGSGKLVGTVEFT